MIVGSALGFGTSSIAIKLLSDGLNGEHYFIAGVWLAIAAGASLAAVITEATALQLRPATVVVPISFAVQMFVPIMLAPLFLREHWSNAEAYGAPMFAGLLLVLAASVVIARRPAVSFLVAGDVPMITGFAAPDGAKGSDA